MGWKDRATKVEAPEGGGWKSRASTTEEPALSPEQLAASFQKEGEAQVQRDLSRDKSFGRGALQGATFGFGDEASGAMSAGLQALANSSPTVKQGLEKVLGTDLMEAPAGDAYRSSRDEERAANAEADKQHGGLYLGGNVAGALATTPLTRGASGARATAVLAQAGLPRVAAGILGRVGAAGVNGLVQGGLFGAGASNADLTRGQTAQFAQDVKHGGEFGGALGLGGGALGEAAQGVAGRLNLRAGNIAQRARDIATKKEAALTKAATGTAGAVRQQGNRLVENIGRLEGRGNLTAEQLAALEQHKPVVAELEQQLADSAIKDLPGKADQMANADALAQELAESEPQRIEDATQLELSPRTAGKHVLALAKRYWPVAAGAAIGHLVPGVGSGFGGLAGRAMSPTIHAVAKRIQQPAIQKLIAEAGAATAGGASRLLGAAGRAPGAIAGPAELQLVPAFAGGQMPAMAGDDLDSMKQRALAMLLRQGSNNAAQ